MYNYEFDGNEYKNGDRYLFRLIPYTTYETGYFPAGRSLAGDQQQARLPADNEQQYMQWTQTANPTRTTVGDTTESALTSTLGFANASGKYDGVPSMELFESDLVGYSFKGLRRPTETGYAQLSGTVGNQRWHPVGQGNDLGGYYRWKYDGSNDNPHSYAVKAELYIWKGSKPSNL